MRAGGSGFRWQSYDNGMPQLVIEEAYLPATLSAPQMTDEEFLEFCEAHPEYQIEMTAEGEIVLMAPNYSLTGCQDAEIVAQLKNWNAAHRRGVVTSPTSLFVLPNGARRAADAAWTLRSRVAALSRKERDEMWRLCPDFVIELKSRTDRLRVLRAKMREWVENGAELAWLIDPERRAIEIYRPGTERECLINIRSLTAGAPVEGFTLNLSEIWDPLPLYD